MNFEDHLEFDPDRLPGVIPPGILAPTPKAKQEKEFKTFDLNLLPAMSPKELADWQERFSLVPKAQTLANHEWKLREGRPAREIARTAVKISIASIIVSVVLSLIAIIVSLATRH